MGTKLVVGCGYLGLRVARRWQALGHDVYTTTRSESRAAALAAEGLRPIVVDVTRGDLANHSPLRELPDIDTLLFAVGYDRGSGQSITEVYGPGLSNVLDSLTNVGRVIYISTTGVYGAGDGDWVDESTPCRPLREGGRASLDAEQRLAAHRLGNRGVVLRLAGIYGPGRIPRAAALKAGEPIDAPADGFLNLIHVDDATEIVLAAETRSQPPAMYVVSDGHPVERREYYAELARLVGAPPPVFVSPDPTSPAAQRAASDKRVRNEKLVRELSVTFRYPSYREGLAAIINSTC